MRPIIVNLELGNARRIGKSTVRWQWYHNMLDNMSEKRNMIVSLSNGEIGPRRGAERALLCVDALC
jgi:hypothetical protein